MNKTTISIIMPVYKVEPYVIRAIESMGAQTFTDYEFLIVDDGTPDGSGALCDVAALSDPRIRVFHKGNGGAPSARNMAMKLARGKYLYFLDSDDWAEPGMLEDMVALAEKTEAELVVTGFFIDTYYSDNDYVTAVCAQPDQVFSSQQEFRENAYRLFDCNLLYTPWNKLYRADYLFSHGLTFPNTFWDDFPFNLSVLRDVRRVAVKEQGYYHFIRARAESETAKYRANMYEKREEEHGWLLDLYRHWGVSDPRVEEMLSRRYIERILGCIENLTNKSCTLSGREKRRQIKEMIGTPTARRAVKVAKPRTALTRLALLPVKWQWPWLCYVEGKYISGVKAGNVKRFATLKARR